MLPARHGHAIQRRNRWIRFGGQANGLMVVGDGWRGFLCLRHPPGVESLCDLNSDWNFGLMIELDMPASNIKEALVACRLPVASVRANGSPRQDRRTSRRSLSPPWKSPREARRWHSVHPRDNTINNHIVTNKQITFAPHTRSPQLFFRAIVPTLVTRLECVLHMEDLQIICDCVCVAGSNRMYVGQSHMMVFSEII